jgi:uncharacterized membrane protein
MQIACGFVKRILQKRAENARWNVNRAVPTWVLQFFGWKGPLPPPQALAAFDDVVQNGAERVFQQFEAQGTHRREMERLSLTAQVQDLRIGKLFAFIFIMGMIAVQPRFWAMSLFSRPSAAARTIFALSTSRVGVLRPRDQRVSEARSSSDNVMTFATRIATILR